jgi:hypothetical protein
MSTEVPVKNLFKEAALEIGFSKKAEYYYRSHKDLLHVIGLRKSRWGDYYSIWLGVSIKAINNWEYPQIHKCHVQCCAEHFVEDRNALLAALNEEDYWKTDADSRRDILKLALTSSLFYFFNQTDTLDGLRHYILNGGNAMLAVNVAAKDFLKVR